MSWQRCILVAFALLAAYLSAWPTPVDPARWDPPPAPGFSGAYQPNALLARTEWLARGVGVGPEAIAVDRLGHVHAGFKDGRVVRLSPDGARGETVANTGGRPLGLAFDPEGTLALFAPRDAMVDRLMPHPWLRKVVYRLPTWVQPAPARYAFALGIDPQGRVVHNLQDPSPNSFAPITSVREHDGQLYLGTVERDAIGRVPAP